MRRDKKAFIDWQKTKRAKRLIQIMNDEDGITEATVNALLEVILKDKLVEGKVIDTRQQRVFVDFLRAKALKKMSDNPLQITIDSLKGFIEK